uniref:Uncharacterized protein n=1 Tax=Strombidium rassoulzadegani TaxID=1082188 RepID=A0A7S3CQF6_9SPIT|mmetsp:Transcript_3499/g.5966  ORF Transcript_3499/g.5966 Transcript_3499/m.5966 type:complete len:284 (+) Transcript_3499:597-1448(+)
MIFQSERELQPSTIESSPSLSLRAQKEKEEGLMARLGLEEFCSKKSNLRNLVVFSAFNLTCGFTYYLINFYMKYVPGDVFLNQAVNSLAETATTFLSFGLVKVLNNKLSYSLSYLATALSCTLIMVSKAGEAGEGGWNVVLGVIGAKVGISNAFNFLYFTTVEYFPSKYLGFVMGFTNVVGRAFTILSPIVAEQKEPLPMGMCIVLCMTSLGLTPLIVKAEEGEGSERELVPDSSLGSELKYQNTDRRPYKQGRTEVINFTVRTYREEVRPTGGLEIQDSKLQ